MTDLDTKKPQAVANTHGGAHNRSVTVLLYPNVAHRVGKNALKLSETTIDASANARYHTRQSDMAIQNPSHCPMLFVDPLDVASLSASPTSSSRRLIARRLSRGESQRDVSGKSGRTKIETIAKKTVNDPSI